MGSTDAIKPKLGHSKKMSAFFTLGQYMTYLVHAMSKVDISVYTQDKQII